MATTRLISMHQDKGKTIASSLKKRLSYIRNPDKTGSGRYVTAYACAAETAAEEFLLGRNIYMTNTGRQIEHEVIAYQVRQSFLPGEVTPEEANRIGYELAMQLLHGEFAFIVATHVDHAHIHNHIVFNSVSLDCTRKFKDVIRSGRVVAELSDRICRDRHLSVIENPQGKGKSYDQWLGNKRVISNRDQIRMMIDAALHLQPDGFDALMQLLEEAGCRIKRGRQLSILAPAGRRYVRLDTLGPEYSEEAIRASLAGNHVHIPKVPRGLYMTEQVDLMIDIEKKMRQGKGKGYRIWAEKHNLDAVAKSIIYLKENHIGSEDELREKIESASNRRNELNERIRNAQARMTVIREQKKAITTYRRTRDIYVQYRESGWSQDFYKEHAKEIDAHKKAQEVYQEAGGKLLTLADLSEEFDKLLKQKQSDVAALANAKDELRNLWHIRNNLDIIANDEPVDKKQEHLTHRHER